MTLARHIFHPSTTGTDQVDAWREATSEPTFLFGSGTADYGKFWFYPVKQEFKEWLRKTADAEISVYHDGVGSDCLGSLDDCTHKLMVMHTWLPRWKNNFEWMIRSTGKVLAENAEHRDLLRKSFPWIPEKYIFQLRSPEIKDSLGKRASSETVGRTGIWLHGENWKRYGNSLRRVVDQWPKDAGELEIVCSGKKGFRLAEGVPVKWSMDLPMEFALLRLYTWDSVLLLNDYSLQSPWLRRAIKLGLFPLIPGGQSCSRTDAWSAENAPRPYDWGNYKEAAQILSEWRANKHDLKSSLSRWLTQLLLQEESECFIEEWEKIKTAIVGQNAPKLHRAKPVSGWMPVYWYEKVQRLRSGL